MKVPLFTCLHLRSVVSNMLDKQSISFSLVEIIIKVMTESIKLVGSAYKNIFDNFYSDCHTGFLVNVFVAFIDKTNSQNSGIRENYWIQSLKKP